MSKKVMILFSSLLITSSLLAGCTEPVDEVAKTMEEQNQQKKEQAAKVMKSVQVPSFDRSLERENIAKRLKETNDPSALSWVYPMSAGRVLGRFPVRGKVTSGNKRLTSTQMVLDNGTSGGYTQSHLMESPDETGSYGSSAPYIFWFDPAGNYFQHQGDYFVSTIPYQIDEGYGTIKYEVDPKEEEKRTQYEKEINSSLTNEGETNNENK